MITLLGVEIFSQFKVRQQNKLRPPIYKADPILGFRLKQGLSVSLTPARRILMLGDSFTQGNEVGVDKTFSKVLEYRLNQNSDLTYEVINAGIRGGSPLQYYLWLKNEGLELKPDIIILNFYLGNDITDALMFNIATDSAGLATQLTLKDTYVDSAGYLRRIATHFSSCELSAFCRLYLRPKPKVSSWNSQAWEITRRHLLAMSQMTQAQFILTLIPQASLIDDPVRQILLDFASQNNIAVIDFTPRLDSSMYDKFDQHWNQSGHERATEVLYEYLLSL